MDDQGKHFSIYPHFTWPYILQGLQFTMSGRQEEKIREVKASGAISKGLAYHHYYLLLNFN